MPTNKEYLLIDFLDKNLQSAQSIEVEELIRNDKEVSQQWEVLKLAVQGIEYAGLREQVASVNKQWEGLSQVSGKMKPTIIRTLYRNTLRVAACLFLLVGSATVYKYIAVSSVSVFNHSFSSYELNTSRGAGNTDKLEQEYRDKNWKGVINQVNSTVVKNNRSYFLAGMANLELKKYDLAIINFQQVIKSNMASGDNYFGDESEYYLALSLIANHEAPKAVVILNKIKADKNHLYNKQASEISRIDLEIIQSKERK
jgi:hypothetical protein